MNAFGKMRFDDHDQVIDVENQKAAFRWVCRHDISNANPKGFIMALRRIATRRLVGDCFGWQGVDIFHFSADGKIKGKFSYGIFGSRPYIQRELG